MSGSSYGVESPRAKYARLQRLCPVKSIGLLVGGVYCIWGYVDTGICSLIDYGYAQYNTKPTLIWLPGVLGVAETSFDYILAFADQFRVISITYPDEIGRVQELAQGVAALLHALGVSHAHFHGGSYSGLIAQCLVRQFPQLVDSLILSHTGIPRPERAQKYQIWRAVFKYVPMPVTRLVMKLGKYTFLPHRTPVQQFWREYFDRMIDSLSHQGLINRLSVTIDFDRQHSFTANDLQGWPGQLLIIEAAHDATFPPDEQVALRALYPQAHVIKLPARQHLTTLENPEEQIAIIRSFLTATVGYSEPGTDQL